MAGLVYIAALAPDEGETSQSQLDQFPASDVFSRIEVAEGRVWLLPSGVEYFAGDLSEQEQQLVWATHFAPAADLLSRNAPGIAWRSKPSWYIVATNDHTVHPELQRFVAKRMGATTYEIDSSHVPMLSHPDVVLDVIRALQMPLKNPWQSKARRDSWLWARGAMNDISASAWVVRFGWDTSFDSCSAGVGTVK